MTTPTSCVISSASAANGAIPKPDRARATTVVAMRHARSVLAALTLATALTACGESSPVVTPKSESLPDCDKVWVAGETLPDDYEGCVDAEGVLKVSEIKKCTSIDGSFTTFGAQWFAMLGGKVSDAGQTSPEYDRAYTACFGSDW